MESCSGCGKSKANLKCGVCGNALCKSCTHFLAEEQLNFRTDLPPDLKHTTYCEPCFATTVTPALEDYEQKMAAAREIIVFEKDQGKETRLVKRDHDLIYVKDILDHDEAILRMAFQCVVLHCNALIDVDLKAKKVKDNSYSTSTWSGSGRPAKFRSDMELKDKSLRSNPN